jgi:hypothetical protein
MRKVILFTLLFFIALNVNAIKRPKKIASIPFEMVGSYVVIKVKINDSSPLKFILDSGIRNTIITELLPEDNVTLNYSDVKDLLGLGIGSHLEALVSNNNELNIGKLNLHPITVHVLQEDIFNLSKHTGAKINGLMGIDFFKDFIIEINYISHRINFYPTDSFIQPKDYEVIPIVIENQKMFVELNVVEADRVQKKVKMLIDTGAELNAWFQTSKDESLKLPLNTIRSSIGQGLNGEIIGNLGRIPQIYFGRFCINNPIVSFPDSSSISSIIKNSNRDGTIGSQLLMRFNYFIDYHNKLFYFKPNRHFKSQFKYNIAGIEISQILPFVPQTEVWKVWENSPAAIAGLRVGDQLIEVNGINCYQMGISELKAMFETSTKHSMKLIVNREGKEIVLEIEMKSIL